MLFDAMQLKPWRFLTPRRRVSSRTNGWTTICRCLSQLPTLMMVIGCTAMTLSYQGTPARSDNRYPLVAMEGEPALWKAKDMVLHYEIAPDGDSLDIRGTVERLNTIKHYPVVSYFRVSIHFLDPDGIILDSHLLWSAGNQMDQRYVRWTFEKQFTPPAGTTAIGFSYRGGFNENGGKVAGKTGWEVGERP